MKIPSRKVKIKSLKADYTQHRLWQENYLLYNDDNCMIGYNYQTEVIQWDDQVSRTFLPTLFYFEKAAWFNLVYIFDKNNPFYYINLSSPFTYDSDEISYIDYDIDIIVKNDFSYRVVDQEEFKRHALKYRYSSEVIEIIQATKKEVIERIEARQVPFNHKFIRNWSQEIEKYL